MLGVWEGLKKRSWIIPEFPLCSFQGEHFGTTEATEAFFAMTRLFQSNDVSKDLMFHLSLMCTGGAIPALEIKGWIMTCGYSVGWLGVEVASDLITEFTNHLMAVANHHLLHSK